MNQAFLSTGLSHYWPSNNVRVREMTLSGGLTTLFLGVPFTSVFVGGFACIVLGVYMHNTNRGRDSCRAALRAVQPPPGPPRPRPTTFLNSKDAAAA